MARFTRRSLLAAASAAPGALSLSQRLGFANGLGQALAGPAEDLTLWYEKPAAQWVDALPIGNGRLGAMVFGGGEDGAPGKELLQINEDTLWSGKPRDGNNPDAKKHLPDVRRAVLEQRDYHLADRICHKMQGRFAEAYQPLCNIRLDFTHAETAAGYRRELDLDAACARTLYTVGDVQFQREAFASHPEQLLIVRVSASKPHQLHCAVSLDGLLQKDVRATSGNELQFTGKAPAHVAGAGHPGTRPKEPAGCASGARPPPPARRARPA